MANAKLNSKFIATVAGDITVFNYDGGTREYISSSVEYLPVGVGIPANSCTDKPGQSKEGFSICRTPDFTAWEYVADHRGETVYSTETGEDVSITALGDYPKNTTTLAPATPYDKWNGSEWVTDSDAQQVAAVAAAETQKAQLRAVATDEIVWRQDAVSAGIATEGEAAALTEWIKYRVLLMRVDTTKPVWPTPPAAQAS
ncbi:tail fiber assembly protein [Kluyvera sp. CRP]|uniref:tail fiber assembly protein n=1 Tax=Kluyvera sp. CRP TaxID=2873269 RepID=UPI001CC214BE|nr:tail fiber assembly protein [Kluyvera sp. CRP]UAK21166.1 tail fiber assembly protein [Kluyvera sp. CRP]